jgi:hypothetical protein
VPKLILKTGKPMDGEYPADLTHTEFTQREWAFMASVCSALGTPGYGLEILTRFWQEDGPAVVALAAVMMQRAGKVADIDALADAKGSAFTWDFSDLEQKKAAEENPPSQSPSENESLGEKTEDAESSG